MESQYYDGTKLLSLSDINGNRPEIYMVTSNRSGGKTTYFNRLLINKFKTNGSKFMCLYRYKYELDDCAEKIFKDVGPLFFPKDTLKSINRSDGVYHELFLNDISCGYAVALNAADMVKKMSHFFSDTDRMFMDEFQSETNNYCSDEVKKFRSIHMSVARGQHKQVRYVPVYMASNPVTILNPYFNAMNISSRLTEGTKFLRGPGFVLEQGYNKAAAEANRQSGFNQAFGNDTFNTYAMEATYLNDNHSFVSRPSGVSRYIATLRYMGKDYAIREYAYEGVVYCDDRADTSCRTKITVTTEDHRMNYVMLKRNDLFLQNLRYYFNNGCFRFKDLQCKEVVLKALSYI